MRLGPYRRVLAVPHARWVVLLGTLIRVPLFGTGVALTLHVVGTLHHSYSDAGLVVAVSTVATAISGPWRGRLLDRVGLRRVVGPALVVQAACWSVAPFAGFPLLLGLVALAGLFVVPVFSLIRQAMIAAVPPADRRTALALDSMAVEVSFMVGPLAGVWLATALPTSWALLVLGAANVVAGGLLFLANPPLRTEAADADAVGRRRWIGRTFIALCAVAAATTLVLSGTDIAVVAVMRSAGAGGSIGVVLAIWGVGSFLGGLAYGALHRELPATWLLAGLAVLTAPVALASSAWSVGALLLLAGVCCAPAITAGVHQVSAVVPESARGEALGWHGSAMTVGSAVGGPLAGAAVDSGGAPLGFLVIAGAGLAVAGVGAAMLRRPVRPAGGGPGVRPGALASER